MGATVHLDGKPALVNDRFAHTSTIAFVTRAHTAYTRAVRSAAIGSIRARAFNPQAKHQRQTGIVVQINYPHHRQRSLARDELAVFLALGQTRAS
jgi:hypothetical protein